MRPHSSHYRVGNIVYSILKFRQHCLHFWVYSDLTTSSTLECKDDFKDILPFIIELQAQRGHLFQCLGHLENPFLIITALWIRGGWKRKHYRHQETHNPQGQRNRGRAAETRQRAAMQTNTADVRPPSLINGCGCLLCPPANNTCCEEHLLLTATRD